ncbi:Calcium-binding protein [Vigna angularis]|uniref:Calcium-binding protein n=1 Tax=Phaseolus angularis TaxID=3914 RepID=A0A8T0JNR0_PHAAN|nr:Calcium-binding protein [Vigna angularis]
MICGLVDIPREMELDYLMDFEDYFPSVIAHMGVEGFIGELCNDFRLLMDVNKGLVTFESLKISNYLLGLDVRDDEVVGMLMEGDLDGDGALSQMKFCILMFRFFFWFEIFHCRRGVEERRRRGVEERRGAFRASRSVQSVDERGGAAWIKFFAACFRFFRLVFFTILFIFYVR